MLGAPPAFVLSQDQTLYKWYLITYKVLNRCNHSDTIACVLYELLVNLELINVGFQTHDQGSTSFSFVQFSRSCSLPRLRDSLYIIHQKFLKVKRFSESFLKKFSSKNGVQAVMKRFSRGAPARQLDYITTPIPGCQHLFSDFSTNFEGDFWAVCIWG